MRLCLFLCLFLTACATQYATRPLFLMGTLVNVTLPADKMSLLAEIDERIAALSAVITKDCTAISATDGDVEISEVTYHLLERGEQYKAIAGRRFDVAAHTIASLYGFPDGAFKIPERSLVNAAVEKIATGSIRLSIANEKFYADGGGLLLDLGAYAKGWIVDNISEFLISQNVNNFIINAGGDLYASGTKGRGHSWRLGIADPEKGQAYISAVNLTDMALATSGVYERFFIADDGRRIAHIFDATTGETATAYKSLSVIAENAEIADALSTIYFLLPEGEIAKMCEIKHTPVFLVRADGEKKKYCNWNQYE